MRTGRPLGIPLLPGPLIGRQAELDAGRRQLIERAVRLLTLTGPPGVGKTSLALALAEQLRDRFSDGAFLVDLSAIVDPDLVASTIADVLGAVGRRRPIERLLTMLRRQALLLVLDNRPSATRSPRAMPC